MPSNFPIALDNLATNKANATPTANDHAEHHNDLADAINKVEAELGTNPSGVSTTVAAAITSIRESLLSVESSSPRRFSVRSYGALANSIADDRQAFQSCLDAIVASTGSGWYEMFIPDPIPGSYYRIGDEINGSALEGSGKRLRILGQGETEIRADFAGAGKALFRFVGAGRFIPITAHGIKLGHVTQAVVHPVLLWVRGAGEAELRGVKFLGANNTVLRLTGGQNVTVEDLWNHNGGHLWLYKDTTGITFTTAPGNATVTASAPIFSAADVGRWFWVYSDSGLFPRYRFTVASVTDSTHAVVQVPSDLTLSDMPTLTAQNGYFEHARCSMTASGTTLVADANVFETGHVGMRVYVRDAALTGSPATNRQTLMGTISSYTSPTTVALDTPAGRTVTNQPFVTPGIEIVGEAFASGSGNAVDLRINRLTVENAKACAILLRNISQLRSRDWKVEGEQAPHRRQSDELVAVDRQRGGHDRRTGPRRVQSGCPSHRGHGADTDDQLPDTGGPARQPRAHLSRRADGRFQRQRVCGRAAADADDAAAVVPR